MRLGAHWFFTNMPFLQKFKRSNRKVLWVWNKDQSGEYLKRKDNSTKFIMSQLTSSTSLCIFIVNFEHISHLFLVFLLLRLNKQMLARVVLVPILLSFRTSGSTLDPWHLKVKGTEWDQRSSQIHFNSLMHSRETAILKHHNLEDHNYFWSSPPKKYQSNSFNFLKFVQGIIAITCISMQITLFHLFLLKIP